MDLCFYIPGIRFVPVVEYQWNYSIHVMNFLFWIYSSSNLRFINHILYTQNILGHALFLQTSMPAFQYKCIKDLRPKTYDLRLKRPKTKTSSFTGLIKPETVKSGQRFSSDTNSREINNVFVL